MMTIVTHRSENPFFENDVLVEEFDYTVVSDPEPLPHGQSIVSKVTRTVAALATGGMLVFCPLGMTTMPEATSSVSLEEVVVQVLPTGVGDVAIPDSHAQAANRFARMFRAVPLADVEKVKEPDYGL